MRSHELKKEHMSIMRSHELKHDRQCHSRSLAVGQDSLILKAKPPALSGPGVLGLGSLFPTGLMASAGQERP